jgi:hypothetical protein
MHTRLLRLGMPVFAQDGPELQEHRSEGKVTLLQVVERSQASAAARQPADASNGWESSDEDCSQAFSNVSEVGFKSVRSRRRVPPSAMLRVGPYCRPPASGAATGSSPSLHRDAQSSPVPSAPEVVGQQRMPLRSSGRAPRRRPIAGRIQEQRQEVLPPSPQRDRSQEGTADTGSVPSLTPPISRSPSEPTSVSNGTAPSPLPGLRT